MNVTPSPDEDVRQIVAAARRLGVEIDEAEALQWLTAMQARRADDELVVDEAAGVFGHRITMLDFGLADLARFRELGRLVGFGGRPGVETALALSGSAAQGKIQSYPGDCDFFERVNIKAPTREAACQVLAELMHDKALATRAGETYRLLEVKFGAYPVDVVHGGQTQRAGAPIAWRPDEIAAGQIEAARPGGEAITLRWDEVAREPGWCKLDWVVADPVRGSLANASNMLDVTWEAPDGAITPLDGYLDSYFQEVYLEAESIPIFSKLIQHISPDALDEYVTQLEREVRKYVTLPNYGKAAKRMYNIFRFTGRYPEAAFIRELFDEPAALLYQVWSLIRTIDDVARPGSTIPMENVLAQADELIVAVVGALEGEAEKEIVRRLLRLRDALSRELEGEALSAEAEAARAEVINVVNNFFYERLTALPTIKAYIDGFRETGD